MMHRITLAALALLLLPGGVRGDQARAHAVPGFTAPPAAEAPTPWAAQDPADSIYRAAREAMNRRNFRQAASLFHQVWDRYPRSAYAPDAPYWEAFSRYRTGETRELERALELLELQRERWDGADTRENGDAQALETRIRGMLARRGDSEAAEAIAAAVNEVAGVSARLGAEVGAQMAMVAREMAAQGEIVARTALEAAQVGLAGARVGSSRDVPEECREQVEEQLAALNALLHMRAERALPVLERVMARRDPCSVPLRRRAVFMIADKRSPRTVDVLLDAARNDPDLEVRRQAVFWLSEVDDPRAVQALEGFVTQSEDDEIRERAIFALAQHDSPAAKRILRTVARDEDASDALRSKAIFWLGTEGSPEDVAFLKEMFARTREPELRERILFSIGQSAREEDARWLLTVAADESQTVDMRSTAIFWAAQAGASASLLGEFYDDLDDPELRERVIFGLSQSSQPEAIDKLIDIVRTEEDATLRRKAIFWLGNSNDPRAAEVLMEVLMEAGGGGR